MFISGRRKTAWLRGTAGLGVVVMLSTMYRPAFATVDAAKGAPAPAVSPPAAPAVRVATATAAPNERVRGAIVPVGVKLDSGAMGGDPWALFDGDATVGFQTGQPLRVRVSLPKGVALEAIGVYGGKGAVVTASAEGKPIAGLERVALDALPARWNRFSAKTPIETSALLLDITPAPGQRAEVPELELWGRVPLSERPSSSRAWAEALLTHLPTGAVQVAASPSSATIAAPQLGPAGHVPLTFDLDRAPRTFERAFLMYELEGLAHWSAVVRRVNWQAPQGGFHAAHVARHGLQVEEISPDWLRQGRNELQFLVSDRNDLVGYKVKNLRVIGVAAAGNPVARPQIDSPRADKIASALVDGSRETGLTNKDIRRPQNVDFRFAETSQLDSLLVAVDKGAKGTLSAQAIVRGMVDRTSQVAAELDQLGTGWARLPLDSLPAEADGIRVTLRGARGESSGGLVSELRVTGSRLPTRRVSSMTVTYPLHGECVEGEGYVRGFLRGDASGSTKGAALRIGGAQRPDALKWDGSFSAVIKPPGAALRSGGKWQVELGASFANGDATGAVVDIEGCKEPVVASKKTGPVEDEGAPFGQVVRAGESAKLAFGGATLEIPAGALDGDTRITIRPISDIDIPATDETLTNVTAGGRAYRLGPHGLKFAKAINLTIPFDRSRFVGGQAEDDMGAYFFDDQAKRWSQVQTLRGDASKQMLTAATTHFTDFIAATISMPDHPTADSFNPNSIKDIKAADPTAGINLIKPPEANPDGAAHLSHPLWVPPGRQGLQPSLNVTYNSSAGNGLMGMGWSLPMSSIGVDTRFGVGRYSRTEETERYEIDGEMLVADPNQPVRGTKTFYHRKAEGKFDTIMRIGANGGGPIEGPHPDLGPVAYHWEVVDNRGTRFIYGETFAARGSLVLRGVFRWYLSRVIDAFGNQILYTYDKQSPLPSVQSAVDLPTVRVLPKTIQYTADANGQNAHYRVEFFYDGQTSGDVQLTQKRIDVFTEARGGTLEVHNVRLARIQVFENPKTGFNNIRRYDFPYITGSFDKSLLFRIIVAQGQPPGDPDTPGGNEFYRHQFNYYQVVKNQTTGRIAFDAPVAWPGGPGGSGLSDGEGDSVNGSAAVGGGVALCEATAHGVIGGSTSLSVPLPLPPIIANHNKNEDAAKRGLIDVNGDGLPDFISEGGVLLNRGDSTFTSSPRSFKPNDITFKTPGKVHVADHTSTGVNANIHFLYESGHVGVGKEWGSSGDNVLLSDIDGDGFVDYLTNSSGLNMTLNSHGQGFSTPAGWTNVPKTDFLPAAVVAEQKSSFSLTEPVAAWTAPFEGLVNIAGVAQKTPNLPSHPLADGVQLIVEHYHYPNLDHSLSQRLFSQTVTVTDSAFHNGPGINNHQVFKGDRIYFRVNAIDDIDDDAVTWSPVINYTAAVNEPFNNQIALTGEQLALPEPFSGAAFGFVQVSNSDMRVSGQPIPTWRNDSAGPDATTALVTINNGSKATTSDAVKFQIFRLLNNGNQVEIATGYPANGFPAEYNSLIPNVNVPVGGMAPGERLVFQVSSDSPIDTKKISWKPHVEYFNYCRRNTLSANADDFTGQTTFCGQVVNCASGTGCQLAGDPAAAANHIATTTISQDIPAYFQLKPWEQFGLPVGFVPPSDGVITFTSTVEGLFPGRVMVRGLNKMLFAADSPGGPVSSPAGGIPVTAGNAVLFDVFVKNVPANALPINGGPDPTTWRVFMHFTGSTPVPDRTILARRNYLVNGRDPGGGHVHGWQYFERFVDTNFPTFQDPFIQAFLAQGGSAVDRHNPTSVNPPVGLMRPAPDGIQVPPPGVSIPGPLWVGSSVDGYIGEALFKPSRSSRPVTGSRFSFSSTSTTNTDSGAGFLFGTSTNYSTSSTGLQFVDMNGDQYPDLVTPGGIQFNRPHDPAVALGGQFDARSPIRGTNLTPDKPFGDLEATDGRHVSESLGISGPVRAGMRLSGKDASEVPGWLSLLPTIGIAYGHTQTIARLLDINGDGLPDYVSRDEAGNLHARLNLGFRPDDPDHAYQFSGDIQYAVVNWSQTGPQVNVPGNFFHDAFSVVPGNDFRGKIVDSIASLAANGLSGRKGLRADALRVVNSAGNNIGAGYSYFGGGLNYGLARTTTDMIDVNGDGLPDMVKRDPGSSVMSVAYNRGDTFTGEQFWEVPPWPNPQQGVLEQVQTAGFGSFDALASTQTHGQSESVGYSAYYETEFFGCWGFEVGVGAGQTHTGSEMRFEDIDGDGAPDQVLKFSTEDTTNTDPNLYVRRNPARGTVVNNVAGAPPNLLANVFGPLGGAFGIDYSRLGNVVDPGPQKQVDMPDRRNVMIRTFVSGNPLPPLNQDPNIVTFFDYGVDPSVDATTPTSRPSGFHDRVNREFLGFGHITITRQGDGLQIQRFYENKSYAGRHNLLSEEIRDRNMPGGAKLFQRTVNTYVDRPVVPGSTFAALTKERTLFYEGLTNDPLAPIRSTTLEHDYDANGNPIRMSDLGDDDPAAAGDDVHFAIAHQSITEPATGAVYQQPKDVFACSVPVTPTATPPCPAANTLRHRSAFYGPKGELRSLTNDVFGGKDPVSGNPHVINQTDPQVFGFEYDGFGNLQIATDPGGYQLNYTYDPDANTHVASIRDSFGYKSSRVYDMRFGALRDTTDVNGNRQHFDSDVFGRQITVFAPQDIGTLPPGGTGALANATIAFDYAIPAETKPFDQPQPVFWARSRHKDASHPTDTIDTVVLVDGLGRVRQTKKDGTIGGTDGRILSGRIVFDQVGRVFQEGFPSSEPLSSPQTAFVPLNPAVSVAKTYAYDVLDRKRAIQTPDDRGTTVAPDGTKTVTTLIDYNAKALPNAGTQLAKTTVDPQGKTRTQYMSPRGEMIAVSEVNRVGTAFPFGTTTVLTTRYRYDRLSQLTEVEDPAGKLTNASYDSLGHLVLLKSLDSGQTEWRYDTTGKLAAKETANLRAKTQLVKYTYEINRLKTVVYPTGATAGPNPTLLVKYTYGTKDEVGAANGNIAGRIARVEDESGVETRKYDALGNVSRMEKMPATQSSSIPGVNYRMDYVYDQLGRIQSMKYPDDEVVEYGYDAGGVVNGVKGTRKNGTQTTYVSSLLYNALGQRVQLTLGNGWDSRYFYQVDTRRLGSVLTTRGTAKVQDVAYGYDLVGNITGVSNNLPTLPPVAPNTVIAPGPTFQTFAYDDLYQLTSASGRYTGCACGCGNERNFTLTMQYDGLGNITRKTQNDAINQPSGTSTIQVATSYNNPYTYGTRPHAPTGVGGTTISYDADGNQIQYSGSFGPSRSLTWTEDDRLRTETDSGFTSKFLYDADGDRTHKQRSTLETWYVNPFYVVKNSLTESKHIMLGDQKIVTAVATITNRADPTTAGTNTLFYYHPDHLQSSSYVTAADGSILQHDEYFPTGEVWLQEQKNNDARNTQPYLFNAKELDETGLYYYGARYYNPKVSVWTSPDPILSKYLKGAPNNGVLEPRNLGLYSYAWNRPTVLRDPDGRAIGLVVAGIVALLAAIGIGIKKIYHIVQYGQHIQKGAEAVKEFRDLDEKFDKTFDDMVEGRVAADKAEEEMKQRNAAQERIFGEAAKAGKHGAFVPGTMSGGPPTGMAGSAEEGPSGLGGAAVEILQQAIVGSRR